MTEAFQKFADAWGAEVLAGNRGFLRWRFDGDMMGYVDEAKNMVGEMVSYYPSLYSRFMNYAPSWLGMGLSGGGMAADDFYGDDWGE